MDVVCPGFQELALLPFAGVVWEPGWRGRCRVHTHPPTHTHAIPGQMHAYTHTHTVFPSFPSHRVQPDARMCTHACMYGVVSLPLSYYLLHQVVLRLRRRGEREAAGDLCRHMLLLLVVVVVGHTHT